MPNAEDKVARTTDIFFADTKSLFQSRRYFEANKDRSYTHGVRHLNCYGTDVRVSSFASHLNTGIIVCCQN